MGISLNNHEDRITALENKGGSKITKTVVRLGSSFFHMDSSSVGQYVELKKDLSDFDILMYEIRHYNKNQDINNSNSWISYHTITLASPYATNASITGNLQLGDSSSCGVFEVLNWGPKLRLVRVIESSDGTSVSLGHMIALKLYYNFSYNIRRILVTHLQNLLRRCVEYGYQSIQP